MDLHEQTQVVCKIQLWYQQIIIGQGGGNLYSTA